MRTALKSIILTVILATIIHIAVVLALPSFIMNKAIQKIETSYINRLIERGLDTGNVTTINKVMHSPPINVNSRSVVAPSPDLVYSIVVYDVSEKPLLIDVTIPDTYWSISFFSTQTDNYYVKNDRQFETNPAQLLLVSKDKAVEAPPNATVVKAATDKGIILFRSLIKSESHFQKLDKERQQITVRSL